MTKQFKFILAGIALAAISGCDAQHRVQRDGAPELSPPSIHPAVSSSLVDAQALARAKAFSGMTDSDNVWQERAANGRVVCGALKAPNGSVILYQYAPAGENILTVPANTASEGVVSSTNLFVAGSCKSHGIVVPTF